jgi:MYXO-CTERM domain-containing protein
MLMIPRVAGAAVSETTTSPYPGVHHIIYVDDSIPVRAHIITMDLTSSELRLVATDESARGMTTSAWASSVGAQVAVNGDLFDPFTFTPDGLAMGPAGAWSTSADTPLEGFVSVDQAMGANDAHVEAPPSVVLPSALPPAVDGVVGGRPLLVQAGATIASFACDDTGTLACERAPRTAAGVSADGHTLYLVVVDGWQADSLGMTDAELATLLATHGAYDALGFDSGSASTLYVANQGGVVNSPSDGVEREVSNQLGIVYGALPTGSLIGFIRERNVFSGADIIGANVVTDSGLMTTSDSMARYSYSSLAPRYTCVTASKAGYHSATNCKQIISNMMEYNSIALFPNSDFIDGGPAPPDAAPHPDARLAADAHAHGDATQHGGDGGGVTGGPSACGCRVASRPHAPAALLVVLLAVFVLVRYNQMRCQPRRERSRPTSTRTPPPAI